MGGMEPVPYNEVTYTYMQTAENKINKLPNKELPVTRQPALQQVELKT